MAYGGECDYCNQPINRAEMWDCPWCGELVHPGNLDDEERWAYMIRRQEEDAAKGPSEEELLSRWRALDAETAERERRYKKIKRKEKIRRLFGKD